MRSASIPYVRASSLRLSHIRLIRSSSTANGTSFLKVQPGKISSKELEHEGGRWVYSMDIRGADQRIHEVQIDARSGKLVSNKTESAAQEAAEARQEAEGGSSDHGHD